MVQYTTHSENETKALASKIAQRINSRVIALTGELGAGKTIFVQGFAKGLGIKDKIISPTYVLIRRHKIPEINKTLYHIDLYRLESFAELGLKEILENPTNIIIIEWAEKLASLPKGAAKILIQKQDANSRILTLS